MKAIDFISMLFGTTTEQVRDAAQAIDTVVRAVGSMLADLTKAATRLLEDLGELIRLPAPHRAALYFRSEASGMIARQARPMMRKTGHEDPFWMEEVVSEGWAVWMEDPTLSFPRAVARKAVDSLRLKSHYHLRGKMRGVPVEFCPLAAAGPLYAPDEW